MKRESRTIKTDRLSSSRRGKIESVAPESGFPEAEGRRRLRQRLLRWFDRHARAMPWRPSPGLYETWVSEIMLQQTQVVTVIPYYQRFLQRFPHVRALAEASEQEVLRWWEGLGYYRRARQLHAAAQKILRDHDGRFPTDIDQIRELPGIGRYTAGAILSIALDQRQPILEANTVRVLSRLLALREDPHGSGGQKTLWAFAETLLPARRVGDFNQALMELGSTVCLPREPACSRCPLAGLCPTKAAGLQAEIPRPKSRPAIVRVHEAAVVVESEGKILLRQCQAGERWAGLWDFPRFPIDGLRGKKLESELSQRVAHLAGTLPSLQGTLATIRHTVTHHQITLSCHLATCPVPGPSTQHLHWVTHAQAIDYPLSVTGRKIWRLLGELADLGPDGKPAGGAR